MRLLAAVVRPARRRLLCRFHALAAADPRDLFLVLFPWCLLSAVAGASRPMRVSAFASSLVAFLMLERVHLRDHAHQHPVDLEGAAGDSDALG